MTPEWQKKIDNVLKSIVEPINLMSLLDLGFIKKVSYSESEKKMLVYTKEQDCLNSGHKCERCMLCGWGYTAVKIRKQMTNRAVEGLQKEFEGYEIELA